MKKYGKVLVVSNMYPSKPFPSYGVFVKNFCDHADELGIRYRRIAMTKASNKPMKLVKYAIFYLRAFFASLFGGYDLVYIHYPSYSAKPVLWARKFRRFDIISNVHGTDVVTLTDMQRKMEVNTGKSIAVSVRTVVPSEYYRALVCKKYKVSPDKVTVYPSGGIDKAVFHEYDAEARRAMRKEYKIDEDAFVLGYVSRVTKAKGWDIFLKALCRCELPADRKLCIFMVGSGDDDDALTREIKALPAPIREAIRRYPLLPQAKLTEIYNMLDAFIFPTISDSESLGLVAIEAMTCGAPVIASDKAAPAYYVKDGVNGYKFEVGNADALAEKITEFAKLSTETRQVLHDGAKATAAEYSRETTAGILRGLFVRK
ncbi:MAG: glycosyltransferase family 4 protein [Lachnospiraceae bacterium]|nr:glycosyltransferase family 4 protein [Lachnospiraceae bacterium]